MDWLRSVWHSWYGKLGILLAMLKPLWDLVAFLGDVSFVVGYVEPVLAFLDTAWGTLLLIIVGLALIYRASTRHSKAESENASLSTTDESDELKQLKNDLREAGQERDELKQENEKLNTKLSDLITPSGGTAAYPLLKREELLETHIKKRTVYIADFAREVAGLRWRDAVLRERIFEDCYIVGPAVLQPMNTGEVEGYVFVGDDTWWEEGTKDAFWSPAEWSGPYTGIVGTEDCVFRNCRFRQVGILFQEQELKELRGESDEGKEKPSNL